MSYPNQNPWFSRSVNTKVRAREAAYASSDAERYKAAKYDFRLSIKAAKRESKDKLEGDISSNDTHVVWQGLCKITNLEPECKSVSADD